MPSSRRSRRIRSSGVASRSSSLELSVQLGEHPAPDVVEQRRHRQLVSAGQPSQLGDPVGRVAGRHAMTAKALLSLGPRSGNRRGRSSRWRPRRLAGPPGSASRWLGGLRRPRLRARCWPPATPRSPRRHRTRSRPRVRRRRGPAPHRRRADAGGLRQRRHTGGNVERVASRRPPCPIRRSAVFRRRLRRATTVRLQWLRLPRLGVRLRGSALLGGIRGRRCRRAAAACFRGRCCRCLVAT